MEIKLWVVCVINPIFMASEDNTVLQNMLGTFKEYYFRLGVCTLSTDAHSYEFFFDVSVKTVWRIGCQILSINPFKRAKYVRHISPNAG